VNIDLNEHQIEYLQEHIGSYFLLSRTWYWNVS